MISTTSGNTEIRSAVAYVNELMRNGTIKNLIMSHKNFDYTNQTSISIAEAVQAFWATNDFKVKVYRPWWRWSKAIAATNDETALNLNVYKLSSYVPDLADTIAHEFIHGANFHVNPNMYSSMATFGHGDNSPFGKENSVPYYIGQKVYDLAVKVLDHL